jgi:hypothetical protein
MRHDIRSVMVSFNRYCVASSMLAAGVTISDKNMHLSVIHFREVKLTSESLGFWV